MAKATIRKGSSGPAVKEWQDYLKSQGYNIEADGIFGPKTLEATKQYQQKNGLSVDGIVGANTWGSMNKNKNTTKTPKTPTAAQKQTEIDALDPFKYDDYTEPDSVTAARNQLDTLQHPGEFQYGNQDLLDSVFDKIMNGEKFSYDLNGDALYQQYKDQFVNQGKLAMQDAMGQAAAMTGGYGNSYAQSVGQQTYQGYLQKLNDKIPELYQLALDKYNMDRQELKDQYGLLLDDRNTQYGIHRDSVTDYYTDRDYYTGMYQWLSDDAWTRFVTEQGWDLDEYNALRDSLIDDRDWYYTLERDAKEDEQWQKQFDLSKKNASSSSAKKSSSPAAAPVVDDDPIVDDDPVGSGSEWTADDFKGYTGSDWEGFFASIRNGQGGQAAAEKLLSELTKLGLIPTNMQVYAAIGARGRLGH